MSLDQAFSTIGDEIRSLEYTLDKLYSLKSFGEMNVNGKVHKVSTGISISKELEVMVKKEISDIIGKIDNFKKILENLEKDKEVKKELNKFSNLEAIDYANNYGYYLKIIYINESTSEAWLLDVEELDEIWIPKSQCKINGNLLFIKKWWFETKKKYTGGEPIHLNDWKKLKPDHYPSGYSKSGDYLSIPDFGFEPDMFDADKYCGACMETPCMCSDPY